MNVRSVTNPSRCCGNTALSVIGDGAYASSTGTSAPLSSAPPTMKSGSSAMPARDRRVAHHLAVVRDQRPLHVERARHAVDAEFPADAPLAPVQHARMAGEVGRRLRRAVSLQVASRPRPSATRRAGARSASNPRASRSAARDRSPSPIRSTRRSVRSRFSRTAGCADRNSAISGDTCVIPNDSGALIFSDLCSSVLRTDIACSASAISARTAAPAHRTPDLIRSPRDCVFGAAAARRATPPAPSCAG